MYICFNSLQTGKCIARFQALLWYKVAEKFQFPSNGKVYSKEVTSSSLVSSRNAGFNSLQTGKCIASVSQMLSACGERFLVSFNSLQTGKCIASGNMPSGYTFNVYAFQFPSNGKVYSKSTKVDRFCLTHRKGFQFPSNGKVHSKLHDCGSPLSGIRNGFQFPSNGKVYSKELRVQLSQRDKQFVSIPFKRESV